MLITVLNFRFTLFVMIGVLCIYLSVGNSHRRCIEKEKQALLKFKQGLNDTKNLLSSWKSEVDCCSWGGILCNNQTGHITKLMLDLSKFSNQWTISGKIDPSLCELQDLTYLNLSYFDFEGQGIPNCIASLGQLRHLALVNDGLHGFIPHEIYNLSNLQNLDLGSNGGLILKDLDWVSHLSSLKYLDLSLVDISYVIDWQSPINKVPSLLELRLGSCELALVNPKLLSHVNSSANLKVLDLSYNYLNSSILSWVLNVSKVLVHLDLSYNDLDGFIPNTMANMVFLEYLDFSRNQLTGEIPKSFRHMYHLEELNLNDNNLSNTVAHSIQQLCCTQNSLQLLHLSYNPFSSGPFPEMTGFSSLILLDLKNTHLEGTLPHSFGYLPHLLDLDLNYNKLSGSLPNFIGLPSMVYLGLSHNNLSGMLPHSFGYLPHLQDLDLSYNKLSGSLPEFIRLPSLVSLDLSHNNLSGMLPHSFGYLPHLQDLDLSYNKLNGSLPKFIGLPSIVSLDFSHNEFNGILPYSFRRLSSLKNLILSSNMINGKISEKHLSHLSGLRFLDVSHNVLSFNFNLNWIPPFQLWGLFASSCIVGPHFPVWLKSQRKLEFLDLSNGRISDSIPKWFWHLSSGFVLLNFSQNKIHGALPKSLPKARSSFGFRTSYDLSFNKLSGPLPLFPPTTFTLLLSNNMLSGSFTSYCTTPQSRLIYLDVSNNLLSGELPDCWDKFMQLEVLNLANNDFSGIIPKSIGFLNSIETIHLNNNSFSGGIPSLVNCTGLYSIDLGENNLNGNLPAWIGHNLTNLIFLRLRNNKLHGSIPKSLCNLNQLQILDLSQNKISGKIPYCLNNIDAFSNITFPKATMAFQAYDIIFSNIFGSNSVFIDEAILTWKGENYDYGKNLGLMTLIDFSGNHLFGEIPSTIASLWGLVSLNLSRNNLTGFIPNNFGEMKSLESLDLSRNSLSGEIPSSFSNLHWLAFLNLSFNNLSGKIPSSTQLQSFEASAYMGNIGLCGLPLKKQCPENGIENPVATADGDDDKIISFGFYVSLVLGFIIGFWGICGSLILKSAWRQAYFQFLRNMYDWLFVQVIVSAARIKRRFQSS